jgi:hypothetical protein
MDRPLAAKRSGHPPGLIRRCPIKEQIMARKRELIDTGTDKRYVRRNERGTSFVESDDVGRSLGADRRKRAKTKTKSGQGDKGDRARPKNATKKTARRKGAARKSARR